MNSHWDPDDNKKVARGYNLSVNHPPLDYAVEQGQPIPPVHKTTWLDRLWNWVRR